MYVYICRFGKRSGYSRHQYSYIDDTNSLPRVNSYRVKPNSSKAVVPPSLVHLLGYRVFDGDHELKK